MLSNGFSLLSQSFPILSPQIPLIFHCCFHILPIFPHIFSHMFSHHYPIIYTILHHPFPALVRPQLGVPGRPGVRHTPRKRSSTAPARRGRGRRAPRAAGGCRPGVPKFIMVMVDGNVSRKRSGSINGYLNISVGPQ